MYTAEIFADFSFKSFTNFSDLFSSKFSLWKILIIFAQSKHFRKSGLQPGLANFKLTWLVLGEDPAARSHRVEQFTAL